MFTSIDWCRSVAARRFSSVFEERWSAKCPHLFKIIISPNSSILKSIPAVDLETGPEPKVQLLHFPAMTTQPELIDDPASPWIFRTELDKNLCRTQWQFQARVSFLARFNSQRIIFKFKQILMNLRLKSMHPTSNLNTCPLHSIYKVVDVFLRFWCIACDNFAIPDSAGREYFSTVSYLWCRWKVFGDLLVISASHKNFVKLLKYTRNLYLLLRLKNTLIYFVGLFFDFICFFNGQGLDWLFNSKVGFQFELHLYCFSSICDYAHFSVFRIVIVWRHRE